MEIPDIFSEAAELKREEEDSEKHARSRRVANAERIQQKFDFLKERIKKGDESTGDVVRDWFVVNYFNYPIIDESSEKLIARWQEVSRRAGDYVGQLVGSFEQVQHVTRGRISIVHSHGDFDNVNTKNILRIGVLTGGIDFQISDGRIAIPVRSHSLWKPDNDIFEEDERFTLVDGPIAFEEKKDVFHPESDAYYALGNTIDRAESHYTFSSGDRRGINLKYGLMIGFGVDEVIDSFRAVFDTSWKPRFYETVKLLGLEKMASEDVEIAYKQRMVKFVLNTLDEVEQLRAKESELVRDIQERNLVALAEEDADIGYHDGDHWVSVSAKREYSWANERLSDVKSRIKDVLTGASNRGVFGISLPISLVDEGKGNADLTFRLRRYSEEYGIKI